MTGLQKKVVRDGDWLAHRYDEQLDAIQFLQVSRQVRDRATFLTDQHLPAGLPLQVLPRRDVAAEAKRQQAPLHMIFHSAFCCSTLLARAFDIPGMSGSLKEPVLLNDVVGFRRRGAASRDVAELLDHSLALLARPLRSGEAVVVKPSNVINGLARLSLALRPGMRAVLLHAPLPLFITSVAKKGLEGRAWVRDLVAGYRLDGLIERFGMDGEALFRLSDLQVAALGWLAQQAAFATLVRDLGADRVRTISSEELLDEPAEALAQVSRLFELGLSEDQARKIAEGPVFARDAKTGSTFGRADRNSEYAEATSAHREEIEMVAEWARVVAERNGIPLKLGAPLLGD
ncbi:hypothetical protein [Sphingomonas sp.]|jgi:hypothetical protein|uniref:hypothetical protein n=1 Tax=Sphingomonas sp. TaxID=28214 RepID=UPI002DE44001|nr:hypothetical protein [Sphingomonas sp.]